MSLAIEFIPGQTLDKCYFVGTEGDKKAAIRATRLLDPKFHTLANEDTDKDDPKVAVQPQDILKELEENADDLETFKTVAFNMAANIAHKGNGLDKKAAEDGPVQATEPMDKLKIEDKPDVAAEKQFSADATPTEGSPQVGKYYARLPKKAVGDPEVALDLQSTIQVLQEQIKVLNEDKEKVEGERDEAKGKLDSKVKEGATDTVVELLSDVGVVEDIKDKEVYKKKLVGLDERALGVIESIVKDILEVVEAKPKVPAGPPKEPLKGPPKAPTFTSTENVLHANLQEDVIGDSTTQISRMWMESDRKKELQSIGR